MQEYILPKNEVSRETSLQKFAQLFDRGHISDWNTCDWFCPRVLGPLIKRHGKPCAQAIAKWKTAQNLWQARASVVAFANLVAEGDRHFEDLTRLVLDSCSYLIKREERFAKTAVGWVLREISRRDRDAVIEFIEKHRKFFSKESLANASKRLGSSTMYRQKI